MVSCHIRVLSGKRVVTLCSVNLAKLELFSSEFPSLYGSAVELPEIWKVEVKQHPRLCSEVSAGLGAACTYCRSSAVLSCQSGLQLLQLLLDFLFQLLWILSWHVCSSVVKGINFSASQLHHQSWRLKGSERQTGASICPHSPSLQKQENSCRLNNLQTSTNYRCIDKSYILIPVVGKGKFEHCTLLHRITNNSFNIHTCCYVHISTSLKAAV